MVTYSSESSSIAALLKKTEHYDKDERYMATSDLCEVLKRQGDAQQQAAGGGGGGGGTNSPPPTGTIRPGGGGGQQQPHHHTSIVTPMDTATERQVCTAVLRLLHDKSNDVQAIAVKTLGVLLTTVQQEQVIEIADSLTDQVLDASKSELRDVYAIGLRTLVKTIPMSMGNHVSSRLVGRLLEGIRGGSTGVLDTNTQEIVLACLDILTDLLGRFGATALSVTRQHEPILQMCLQQLQRQDNPAATTSASSSGTSNGGSSTGGPTGGAHVIRKRAGNTIGCLSTVLSDTLLQRMVDAVLTQIDQSSSVGGDVRALIRTMCTVAGAVGHRLGQTQIDRILPIFLKFTKPEDAITGDDDDNNEMNATKMADNSSDDDVMDTDSPISADEAALQLANELRESCFMGFEAFTMRCPNEVEPHLEKIIQAALAYMSYDPNYSYGVEADDEDDEQKEPDDDEIEQDEDDEYDDDEQNDDDDDDDDDDDESWKVRRSAIRALRAIVEAKKHDPASTLWKTAWQVRSMTKKTTVAAALVSRFKEREENCRVGVIDCFTRLLAVTIQASANNSGVVKLLATSPPTDDDSTMAVDTTITTTPVIYLRAEYATKLVKACEKILSVKKGNDRSKSSALSLLATLCRAPGGVGGQAEISTVFKHVKTFLLSPEAGSGHDMALHREGTSKALRLDALQLVHSMLVAASQSSDDDNDASNPVYIRRSLRETLLPELCQAVKEQWYKVIAEALRALTEVPRFFTDIGYTASDDNANRQQETMHVATILYNAVEPLLAAHDVDQEIKECALKACAELLSNLHTSLSDEQTNRLLSLLLDRLKNETTRIAAIKTLSSIATSNTGNNLLLSPIFAESITTMASFLKLSSRSLQQSSLEAIDKIVLQQQSTSDPTLYSTVLQEIAPLIVDKDLHLSHLSLRASVSILHVCPEAGPAVKEHVMGPALELSTSSLLQDVALDSLLALLKQVVISNAIEFQEMLSLLRGCLTESVAKHGVYNLAKSIAVITATTSTENRQRVLDEIFFLLEGSQTPEEGADLRQVQLSLLISGDLGRMVDLAGAADRLKTIYLGYFDSSSDDLKHAASYALGNASVGSPSIFLQAIVSKLDEDNKKQQYLLLSALREFIQCSARKSSADSIASILPIIVPPLEKHCSDEEEGVRTMVAECLGSLCCLEPETMLPKLVELQTPHSMIVVDESGFVADDGTSQETTAASLKNSRICWTVASSIKLAVAGKVDPTRLVMYMPTYMQLLQIKELHSRHAALLMIYSAAHHMPQVVSPFLRDSIMPSLYEVAELKLERRVDLGPFKHTIDDALQLRKAALSIFATCLENLPGSLDITSFMPVLAKALNDAEEIQLHAHQILIAMCARQPSYVTASVDSFVDPLEKTITKKQGQKSGTELERFNDWIKSALRVIITLSRLDGTMNSRRFAEFVERVKANSKYTSALQAIEEEQ